MCYLEKLEQTYLKFHHFLLESGAVNSKRSLHCWFILTALLEGLSVVDLVLFVFREYLKVISTESD